jgi:hypothetical protein
MTSYNSNSNICIKAFTVNSGATVTQPTQLTLEPSTVTPTVGNSITFTASLTNGTTALSGKPVTIYHYFNSVQYSDTTTNTDSAGQIRLTQSFTSTGQRTYYATFTGDSTSQTSTSTAVKIDVSGGATKVDLQATTTTPTVGQSVTFTATLKSGTALSGKPVTIYHYFNGVKYTDTTTNTNSAGQIKLTQSFRGTGQRTYYATFAGDSGYQTSTSSVTTINVK